ncbi:efflux RND transporter permease subunit [Gemmatimonas aurantiaca]|uniref:efflux RND transporter permease subunit n=1 Tax=Gemmatimonas aurantiaca TaxID=173480 RepID=UPI00301D02CD
MSEKRQQQDGTGEGTGEPVEGMNISEIWIRRPVMTTLVMLSILIFGILAYQRLPVSDLPTIDYPTITVSAGLPGASPEVMATSVATPLEQQFATISGIDNITSSSSQGSTNVTIQFNLDRDIDKAAADVQSGISKALRQLPQGINPPSYNKANAADAPIVMYSLNSDVLSRTELNEYAETFIAQRLSTITGVAQVQVYGSAKYAVRVQLDPSALAQRGIGIDEVQQAINTGNSNSPAGVLMGPNQSFTLQATGQLKNAAEFRALVVAYRNGTPVRLGDLGNVFDGLQNMRGMSELNGRSNISLAIIRQPGANTVATAKAVDAEMQELLPQLPPSVQVETIFNRALSIEHSVWDVQFTLMLTVALVVMVIFLFLRNVRATIIPSLALPFSIIGTCIVMYALGFSLNNLTLMALTLAVGFVVDDAIVMLENIVRHMEMGKGPLQAALDGSREISFTILSMTLSLVAVFIPLLFMPGLVGRLFREFAVTIGVAILVSGIVSLTLTPMLAAKFLKGGEGHAEAEGKWRSVERIYQTTERWYVDSLGWVMRHRPLTMLFSALTLGATVLLFIVIPKGFLPSEDTGRLQGSVEGPEGIGYDALAAKVREVGAILTNNPNVKFALMSVGGGPGGGSNSGRIQLTLVDRSERQHVDQVMRELTRATSTVPGVQVFFRNPPPINIGGRRGNSAYSVSLQGADIAELYTSARALEQRMRELPQLENISSDLQVGNPQVAVTIDRERASALGVTASQIENAMYNAYGQRQVSTIYTQVNQYQVILELLPEFQRDPASLSQLFIRSNTGNQVPLGAVATFTKGVGPQSVQHNGQQPAVSISFNTRPNVALGDAVNAVQHEAAAVLPTGVTAVLSGDTQAFAQAQSGLLALLVVAIFVIYVVLGILYESFVHPLTILSGLPFAAVGALATLMIFGKDLSVYAYVGVIMLIGLVKKNAIMMIDFAIEAERNEGMNPTEAILEAARVRFRPIMMTTMAALMGTLPIAIGYGAGAESRQPLGLAVVGGLAFSQLITLYVTPVVYTYLDGFVKRGERRREAKAAKAAARLEPVAVTGD